MERENGRLLGNTAYQEIGNQRGPQGGAGRFSQRLLERAGLIAGRGKIRAAGKKTLDLILLFVRSEAELKKKFAILAANLAANGMLWVAWPKKSSGVVTDLSFDNVQRTGLEAGLVDVKICAVNDIWSGLKFVYRLKDRPSK